MFDGVAGVEPQTETVWRQANKYGVPRMCFVNKLDRMGADFYAAVESIKDRLDAHVAVLQLPIGTESDFAGVIDLVEMKALIWHDGNRNQKFDIVDIPASTPRRGAQITTHPEIPIDDVSHIRRRGPRESASKDEESMPSRPQAADPQGHDPTTASSRCSPALRSRTRASSRSLGAVVDYLPSPLDVPPTKGIDPKGKEGSALRAKRQGADSRPSPSRSSPTRHGKRPLLPGVLPARSRKGAVLQPLPQRQKERRSRHAPYYANNREDLDVVTAGDIVAGIGLKDTRTGDTLCDEKAPIVLEELTFPEPVIHVAVEPKTKQDQDKMGKALYSRLEERTDNQVHTDEETGQTIIASMEPVPRGAGRPRIRQFASRGQRSSKPRSPTADPGGPQAKNT